MLLHTICIRRGRTCLVNYRVEPAALSLVVHTYTTASIDVDVDIWARLIWWNPREERERDRERERADDATSQTSTTARAVISWDDSKAAQSSALRLQEHSVMASRAPKIKVFELSYIQVLYNIHNDRFTIARFNDLPLHQGLDRCYCHGKIGAQEYP